MRVIDALGHCLRAAFMGPTSPDKRAQASIDELDKVLDRRAATLETSIKRVAREL